MLATPKIRSSTPLAAAGKCKITHQSVTNTLYYYFLFSKTPSTSKNTVSFTFGS